MAESKKNRPLTVLVTGFGPFNKYKINSSWEAVKDLPSMGLKCRGEQVHVEVRHMRVSYVDVRSEIAILWKEIKPDICVHVGLSPSRVIKLEKYACNKGYLSPDVDFLVPIASTVHPGSPEILESTVDLDKIRRQVLFKQGEVKVELSFNAGQFLCDFIYYLSLHINEAPVLFVHVPPLDEPYSKSELSEVIKNVVEAVLSETTAKKADINQ